MKNILCIVFFVAIVGDFVVHLTLKDFIHKETKLNDKYALVYEKEIYKSAKNTYMHIPAEIRKGYNPKSILDILKEVEKELQRRKNNEK